MLGREVVDYAVTCDGARGRARVEHRRGLRIPLEVNLHLANGNTMVHQWDGEGGPKVFTDPGLTGASLGPAQRLGLDPTPLDNRCQVAGRGGRSSLRLAAILQLILQLVAP